MVQAAATSIGLQWRRITFIWGTALMLFLCNSCKQHNNKPSISKAYNYKEFSLNRIESFSANDGGYKESDSFKIYPFGNCIYFTGEYFVTRTIDSSEFVFLFWQWNNKKIYFEKRVSKLDFEKNSVFDANGDSQKDFVFYWHPRNGICQPLFAEVFLSDSVKKSFTFVDAFADIPNPVFDPKKKQVSSLLECKAIFQFLYKWNGNKLEEIFYKATPIHD